jgi:hypothetical protein
LKSGYLTGSFASVNRMVAIEQEQEQEQQQEGEEHIPHCQRQQFVE